MQKAEIDTLVRLYEKRRADKGFDFDAELLKLPWRAFQHYINVGDGRIVAHVYNPEAGKSHRPVLMSEKHKALVQRIVTAVNHHKELVEALGTALKWLEHPSLFPEIMDPKDDRDLTAFKNEAAAILEKVKQ